MSNFDTMLRNLDEIVTISKEKGLESVFYLASLVPVSIQCVNGYLQANHRNYRIREFNHMKIKIEIY